jgi:hypothetical protein
MYGIVPSGYEDRAFKLAARLIKSTNSRAASRALSLDLGGKDVGGNDVVADGTQGEPRCCSGERVIGRA